MNKGISFRRRLLKTAGSKQGIRAICFSTLNPNEQQTVRLDFGTGTNPNLQYSTNGVDFQTYTNGQEIIFGGENKVWFRGKNNRISIGTSGYCNFKLLNDNVLTKCDGNIMHLLDYEETKTQLTADGAFIGLFKDCKALYTAPDLLFTNTRSYCCFQTFMNCISLIKIPKMIINENTLSNFCFSEMFAECENLQNIDNIDITFQTIGNRTFSHTFRGCSNLKTIPFINGKELYVDRDGCNAMFYKCTNLEENINLIIEKNKNKSQDNSSFNGCFRDCKKIKNANIIVNDDFSKIGGYFNTCFQDCTGLENVNINYESNVEHAGGFNDMFNGCTNLRTFNADENFNCYIGRYDTCKLMFKNCTNLETVNIHFADNELIITGCYESMFENCTSLTTAPQLPAQKLSYHCYKYIFKGCSSLVNAPELNATELGGACYTGMFTNCTSLINAPELPAIVLKEYCYDYMFDGCTNLINAPELLATTLAPYCYRYMFRNCNKLNNIKCLAEDFSATDCVADWTINVSSTGTFIKKDGVQWNRGSSGIPTNWTVQNASGTILNINLTKDIVSEKYGSQLNIESNINWEVFSYPNWIQLDKLSGSGNDVINVQYIDDQQGKLKAGIIFVKNLITNTTEQVNLYGLNTIKQELTFFIGTSDILRWKFNGSGDPNPKTIEYTKDGGTTWTSITSSDNNSLNGITVLKGDIISFRGNNIAYASDNNIGSQFGGGSSLTHICGNIMSLIDSTNFENLTQLTQPFALHALFKGFINLKDASNLSLPATTLTQSCYRGMFEACNKLLYAPELPASQLVQDCYRYMFNNCKLLIYIKCLCDTNIQTNTYTQNWLGGAKNTNECKFVKKSTTQIYRDNNSGIPNNWVVENI